MDSFAATNKILENLKMKYKYVDNIMNLTKDMERAMMANDSGAFGSILDMRGDVMILVDQLDQSNLEIAHHLPKPLKDRIMPILTPSTGKAGEALVLDNALETNIYDTNKRTVGLLSKVIKLDTEINQKLKKTNQAPRLKSTRG